MYYLLKQETLRIYFSAMTTKLRKRKKKKKNLPDTDIFPIWIQSLINWDGPPFSWCSLKIDSAAGTLTFSPWRHYVFWTSRCWTVVVADLCVVLWSWWPVLKCPSFTYIETTIVSQLDTKWTLFFKRSKKKKKKKWIGLVFVLAASLLGREEVVLKQSSKLVGIIPRLLRNLLIPCVLSAARQ